MNETQIRDLSDILSKLSESVANSPQLIGWEEDSAMAQMLRNHNVDPNAPEVFTVVSELQGIDDFRIFEDCQIRVSPSSGLGGRLTETAAEWLLAQSKFRDPDDVVRKLLDFVQINSVTISEVFVLWGVNPTVDVDLGNGIKLVNISQLVPSLQKDLFLGRTGAKHYHGVTLSAPRPMAALKRDIANHRPIYPGHGGRINAPPPPLPELSEVIHILPLLAQHAVCPLAHLYECEIDLPFIGGVRGGGGQEIHQVFCKKIPPAKYAETEWKEFIAKYLGLSQALKDRLFVPINRLNNAMRIGDPTQKAIELGIAAESLFTSDKDHDAPISYSLRQRATAFLGGTPAEKRQTFRLFRDIYNLRSQAVHTGRVPDETKDEFGNLTFTERYLQRGCSQVSKIVSQIIVNEMWPDWEAKIMGW